jgi:hypothetical protein
MCVGLGDSIITTATVKKAYAKTKRLVMPGDGNRIYWSEIFDNNPKMSREVIIEGVWVHDWPGHRPYVDLKHSTSEHMRFNGFKVEPGELYLTDEERNWPQRDFVYIEPNVKREVFGDNKDWGFERWQRVVDGLPHIRFVQGRGRKLEHVEQVQSDSFRHVAGLLSHANLFVGTDGGLHHAAAAIGIPAVVVWGGLASPLTLGYEAHVNLHAGSKPCGSWKPCNHCKTELAKISETMVIDAIESQIRPLQKTG